MAKRKPLDARTLRSLSRRLRLRAEVLESVNRAVGRINEPYTEGILSELEHQSLDLRREAARIERARKRTP